MKNKLPPMIAADPGNARRVILLVYSCWPIHCTSCR